MQGAALLGYPNFFLQNRELSILILGINWAIAMSIWMAVRGHPLRHNMEMSSTAVVAAVVLIVAYWWFGFAPATRLPGWFGQFMFQSTEHWKLPADSYETLDCPTGTNPGPAPSRLKKWRETMRLTTTT